LSCIWLTPNWIHWWGIRSLPFRDCWRAHSTRSLICFYW